MQPNQKLSLYILSMLASDDSRIDDISQVDDNHNENINGDNVVKADEDNKEGVKDEKSSVENEKCVKGFENL